MSRPYTNLVMFDRHGYPRCEKHGALLCVNKEQSLWRCPTCGTGVSFESVESLNRWIEAHSDVVIHTGMMGATFTPVTEESEAR